MAALGMLAGLAGGGAPLPPMQGGGSSAQGGTASASQGFGGITLGGNRSGNTSLIIVAVVAVVGILAWVFRPKK